MSFLSRAELMPSLPADRSMARKARDSLATLEDAAAFLGDPVADGSGSVHYDQPFGLSTSLHDRGDGGLEIVFEDSRSGRYRRTSIDFASRPRHLPAAGEDPTSAIMLGIGLAKQAIRVATSVHAAPIPDDSPRVAAARRHALRMLVLAAASGAENPTVSLRHPWGDAPGRVSAPEGFQSMPEGIEPITMVSILGSSRMLSITIGGHLHLLGASDLPSHVEIMRIVADAAKQSPGAAPIRTAV